MPAGKINAVTGEAWANPLAHEPQDYVVVPGQPWLDGFAVSRGMIRQFVAMPLGAGDTAEEQLTGTAEHGGVQIVVYPMKAEVYQCLPEKRPFKVHRTSCGCLVRCFQGPSPENSGICSWGSLA